MAPAHSKLKRPDTTASQKRKQPKSNVSRLKMAVKWRRGQSSVEDVEGEDSEPGSHSQRSPSTLLDAANRGDDFETFDYEAVAPLENVDEDQHNQEGAQVSKPAEVETPEEECREYALSYVS
jgi:hypothetical protein